MCMYVYLRMYIYICKYICMCVNMFVCTYVCISCICTAIPRLALSTFFRVFSHCATKPLCRAAVEIGTCHCEVEPPPSPPLRQSLLT